MNEVSCLQWNFLWRISLREIKERLIKERVFSLKRKKIWFAIWNIRKFDLIHFSMKCWLVRYATVHFLIRLHFFFSYFPLRLKRDLEIFAPSFPGAEGEHKFSPGNIYEGWIEGEFQPRSSTNKRSFQTYLFKLSVFSISLNWSVLFVYMIS